MKTNKKVRCYLGATLIHPGVFARVQRYSDEARIGLGMDSVILRELHITLLPPFETTYESATRINLACACSTIIRNHPLTSTSFLIRNLSTMCWENVDVLHFPIKLSSKIHQGRRFLDYIESLRNKVTQSDEFMWKETIPDSFYPHITVATLEKRKITPYVQSLIEKSRKETPVCFHAGYPTLYAKYKTGGWYTLSQDPNLDGR